MAPKLFPDLRTCVLVRLGWLDWPRPTILTKTVGNIFGWFAEFSALKD